MKHTREDYNKRIQDSDNLIPEEEPVFLLRGQDVLAPELVRQWANRLESIEGSAKMVDAARTQADKMEEWQLNQKGKVPDLD